MFKDRTKRLAAACLFAGALALPTLASAGDRFDRGERYRTGGSGRDDDRDLGRGREPERDHRDRERDRAGHVDIELPSGSHTDACAPPPTRIVHETVWVDPVYRTVSDRRWIEPVYRTVNERVWVEPVVERVPDRAGVPDRYEWQEVVRRDRHGRRYCSREYVPVEPAHFIDCTRDVVVRPGRWEDRGRTELVCAGRWETVTRQELVCAGHYETRPVAVTAPAPPPARRDDRYARIDLRFPVGR